MFEDGSVSMSDTEQLEAAEKIVGHILSVKEYRLQSTMFCWNFKSLVQKK